MEKVITTKRGVEYNLEVVSFDAHTIEFFVACEEDTTTVYMDSKLEVDERNLEDIVYSLDLSEINNWVDEVTTSYLSAEFQKYCIRKSKGDIYYSFFMYTHNLISVTVNAMDVENEYLNGRSSEPQYYLRGEKEIKEFLRLNK